MLKKRLEKLNNNDKKKIDLLYFEKIEESQQQWIFVNVDGLQEII